MKTPREILLARHRAAEVSLNQIRREVVAEMVRQETTTGERALAREMPWIALTALKLWREVVWPSRRIWASLTAVWLMILGYHLIYSDRHARFAHGPAAPAQQLRSALEQRRELIAEFALLPQTKVAKPPKHRPQPRSERPSKSACA